MLTRAELMHALVTEKDPRERTRIHGICRIVIEKESYSSKSNYLRTNRSAAL